MNVRLHFVSFVTVASLSAAALVSQGCRSVDGKTADRAPAAAAAIAVAPVPTVEQQVARFVHVTGSLIADERAEVAAETRGRVVRTPIERGTAVTEGDELVRLSSTETEAQAREAEANASQIEARLGLVADSPFDVVKVPEVQTAQAAYDLAKSDFNRIQSLLDQRVVSQAEFDQRRTQMEATRQQYESARNAAAQQYQALQAARARVTLAHKALADTVVRAPFAGLIAERLVSVGDFVTSGTKVAVVVRVDQLRVQLTVPEQFVAAVGVGQPVSFEVDAYPNRQFVGHVRYVSPALESNQRALTVEAVVPNPSRELKPGLFATVRVELPKRTPALLVPADAVRTTSGTSRVFVIADNRAQERIVTLGQPVDGLIEITTGLSAGERVATKNVAQLVDGLGVSN
jgi:multidrug efflux pump subunit AcrA (membrane-fusion protein)